MTPTHPKANMRTCRFELSPAYAHLEEFCKNIAQEFAQSNATIHRARNELKTLHVKGEALVVKSFKVPKGVQKWVYSFWKNSKAKTSYLNGLFLQEKGICTPQPIGYVEFYEGKILKESYFIAQEWTYDFTIREPLLEENFPDKEAIFKAFAHLVHTLHTHHITHKDLSPGNVLIRREGLQLCVVDINRMGFSPLSTPQKLANFSKLWAKDGDLKSIISHYATLAGLDPAQAYATALAASHRLKAKINFKKRLRGVKVVD